jgi:hypothetical protein
MLVGGIFSRLDHFNETQADTDRLRRAYLSKSFHRTRQRPSKVTISDDQFGIDAPKRKLVHHIQLGISRRNQEGEVVRAVLLDTARIEARCRLDRSMGKRMRTRVPSVENIYLDLLRGSLDRGDFIVRNGFPGVVIADLSLVAFANEQTRLRLQGIDVVFQLYRDSDICGPKPCGCAPRSRGGPHSQRWESFRPQQRTLLVVHAGRTS